MKIACLVGWVPGLECVWLLLMLGCDSSLHGDKNTTFSLSAEVSLVSDLARSRVWWRNFCLLAETLGHVVEIGTILALSLVGVVYSGLRGLSTNEGCFAQRFSRELRVMGVVIVEGVCTASDDRNFLLLTHPLFHSCSSSQSGCCGSTLAVTKRTPSLGKIL